MSYPHKVSTTLNDDIVLLTKGTYAPITGKVQADFTISVTKNGAAAANTGITLTEVNAGTRPGVYHISCNGTTSFVSATGSYLLQITLTADDDYTYAQNYDVTNDGTGAGTVGAASFTATAGDGRVTDGTSALQYASVYVKRPSGALYAQLTSSATGVWGPVYFDADGIYTVVVQRSGYASGVYTITVSGASATGSGGDVALTVSTTGTGLTLAELKAYARRQARDVTGNKADAEIKSAINDALKRIAYKREWPWYLTTAKLTVVANYSTGTVTTVNGDATVTLATGTWPSWVDALTSIKIGDQFYAVASRTSDAEIELAETWSVAAVAGGTYNIFKDQYTLASDLVRFGRIYPGNGWVYGGEPTGYEAVLQAKNMAMWGQKSPQLWAVYKDRFACWPYTSELTAINYSYWRAPATLSSDTDASDWDPAHLELLHRAIDLELAALYGTITSGTYEACLARFNECFAVASKMDKTSQSHNSPLGAHMIGLRVPPRITG